MPPTADGVLTPRYDDALAYALHVHSSQLRKGTSVPYAAHLLAASSLVLEAGGDEDLAIAALLHDAAEDRGGEGRLADIEDRFGGRVARIVRDCSDSLDEEGAEKRDWETRKREHLDLLRGAPSDSLMVWTADKVHNARAIVTDLMVSGPAAMERFHAAPDRIEWYYEENLALAVRAQISDVLVAPLTVAVGQMRSLLGGSLRSPEGEA